MPRENITYTPEVEAGISQAADAFVKLYEMKSPVAARSWVENIARFSESPLAVKIVPLAVEMVTLSPLEVRMITLRGEDNALALSLTACGRVLSLEFSKSGKLKIEYDDGNLRQTSEIKDVPWANISSVSPSHLLILLENGEFVGIKKEFGTVVVESIPFDQIPFEDNF